ncbi:Flp pilus assembly protein TadD, contains TPR repeats [Lentzea albidocapillata subsp. violacea]|uniref:Flp pilus assembly protein TadD, contains TPR repeats n=1 Tax=Lentzea albidocapillata subsp. violacea TaxID=128104 RepID=A0A1G9F593_9PSEU|nr:tetratricopeptide repeat protein [Lentzea albidocapillata]SDK83495.1 Flp pilus assembly protein TadD, contains TPR repeats [Lentzea albidocapillata subsp. violacea]
MNRRKIIATLAITAGVALLATTATALSRGDDPPPAGQGAAVVRSDVQRTITAAQDRLRRVPGDAGTWALLGSAYVEQARITGDPAYYGKAQGALETSLRHQPDGNGPAHLGLGALANARHDFAAARAQADLARTALPDTAEVYGVLADALTQLGAADEARAAVQRMLDLEPGVPAFTRAAYDFEQRGDVDSARQALTRALDASSSPAGTVFCRYHLGELAFDNGDLDEASAQYERGLLVDPLDPALLQGRAKIAAARGNLDDALTGYADLVARVPSPQYLHEHAVLLRAAGRTEDAARQFDLLAQQERLLAAAGSTDDLAASVAAADRGDPATALAAAEREWNRRQHPLVADALAWALHLAGRDAEALPYADRAAATGWRNATFAYHRGMILRALGRTADAADALGTALRTNPHFSPVDAPAARAALDGLR